MVCPDHHEGGKIGYLFQLPNDKESVMTRLTLALSAVLIAVAGGVALLPADEPEGKPTAPAATDLESKLLQRIEQLETRVAELEKKLAAQQTLRFTAVPAQPEPASVPDSPALRNLPKQNINGHTFYFVPLKQ